MSNALTKAKIRLLMEHPFFASILLRMEVKDAPNIPTACTDGKVLLVNTKWFETLTSDEQIGVLAHECMHPALLHHTRRHNRDPKTWNKACDYTINPILFDAGLKLPKGVLYEHKYADLTADQVYNDIYEDEDEDGQGQAGGDPGEGDQGDGQGKASGWEVGDGFDGGLGDVMDYAGDDVAEEEQRQKEVLVSSALAAKREGKLPASLDGMISDVIDPKVDYEILLRRWISEKSNSDYLWTKPSRRFLPYGIYMPALENETYGEIGIMIDTSGSVSQEDLNEYAAEMNEIIDIVKAKKYVIYADSKVQGYEEIEGSDPVELTLKGGGGTRYSPAFEKLDEEGVEPKAVLYFTDGYCYDYPSEPNYPVLWMIAGRTVNKHFKPPFGDVIYI